MVKNPSRKRRIRSPGRDGIARLLRTSRRATAEKKNTSTIGEIQRISRDTWIIGPQRSQFTCWNTSNPTPSRIPAATPSQMLKANAEVHDSPGARALFWFSDIELVMSSLFTTSLLDGYPFFILSSAFEDRAVK